MIYTNVDMTIANDKSTVNSKVVLYRGDKNVEIRLYMKGNRFVVQQNMYAQLIIVRPSAPSVFSEIAKINNDTVILTITGDMIDEFKETGEYSFQIRLYDDNQVARVTLPPVQNGIVIKNPIAVENESIVELALVDSAVVYADLSEEITDIFDEDKVYIMTDWQPGDVITAARLNKIEEGLYYVSKNGGGGGGATAPYISTTLPETVLVNTNENLTLDIDFNSPNPGKGTLRVFVNNVDTINTKIMMGESKTVIPYSAFARGSNQITVYVIDRVGVISNTLTFYVRYGGLEMSTTFDSETAYDVGANVRFYFTPTALDTSKPLTMYMEIDGAIQEGVQCTSDTRAFFTFPNTLTAGGHACKAWITDGENKSEVLEFTYVLLDDTTLVIASYEKNLTAEEGIQLSFAYKVYKKNAVLFNTEIYVNDSLYATGSCGLEKSYFVTDQLPEGTHTVKIVAKTPDDSASDYITWNVTITPSTYQMIQPVKTGSMFIATAKNKSNTAEDKESWIGTNQDNEEIPCILNNFAYNSENGWVDNALTISGQSYVEVPIAPLANNAKYGFTLDIEFSTKHIGVENAEVLTLWDDTKNCGIKITTDEVIMRSAVGNELRLYFSENETISAIFEIDRDEKTAKIFLNGVMCKCMPLNDYVASGVTYLEDFSTDSHLYLGGKNSNGWCKIRNIRIYEVCLGTTESLNNFICNILDKQAQKNKVKFQTGEHLPTLTVYGDFSGLGKNDKKPCDAVFTSTDVTKYGESWKLDGMYSQLQYQGTSSMQYPIKNYRLNPRDANGKRKLDPFNQGIGETRFTLKADFASSGHWQNTGLAKWINDHLYNYNANDPKSMSARKLYDITNGGDFNTTRECIDGFICRLILVNNGETPLLEGQEEPEPGNTKDMGVFNFNNDKSNVKTFGFDQKIFPDCISFEVASNSDTSAGAFMSFKEFKVNATYSSSEKTSYLDVIDVSFFEGKNIDIENLHSIKCLLKDGTFTNWLFNGKWTSQSYAENVTGIMIRISGDVTNTTITMLDKKLILEATKKVSNTPVIPQTDPEAELAYYRESFELRFPDEDDVGPAYGYLDLKGDPNKSLKRVVDFTDNSSDEEFVRDFELYFHKDYTFRYYIIVIVLAMVDNLGKNMMFDSFDGKIFLPRFYDMDTICSFDNSGVIKFETDIEMEQGYWNTSSSRLWTRIRDLFHDELVAKYNEMRKNSLSYESLMSYFYDEQIAMIPERYYNMDYDVKYGPYADQYANKANGSSYEHLKRWLKRRFQFTDTLFDYTPAYTNDTLTIRANTTEPMTLEIETYVPVYQHMSWYNNQMDKKKIDGKTAVTFTGTAQAATDQEVIIYGGSNIKRIRGISSMNPDSMLIGNADRLMELECKNAPLLTDINSNKANLSANRYLTKVDLSGCTALGGTLRLNNSPLIQEINIQNTAIDNLLLPTSLLNLKVIRLPKAIKELTFENLSSLEILSIEGEAELNRLSLTNCPRLDFTIFKDIKKINNLYLNNALTSAKEISFNDVPVLEVANMPNLERIVYHPNDEYEDITIEEMQTKGDITVKATSCNKLKELVVTAPQRISYGESVDAITPYQVFAANLFDISQTKIDTLKFLCTTDIYNLKVPGTLKNLYCDSAFDIDTQKVTDASYDFIHNDLIKPYTEEYNENVLIKEAVPNKKLECTNFISGKLDSRGFIQESNWWTGEEYIEVMPNTNLTTNNTSTYLHTSVAEYDKDKKFIKITTKTNPCTHTLGKDTIYIRLSVENKTDIITYTGVKYRVPNIIPTAANGSIVCNMWSDNTNQPTSTSPYIWDLKGLKLNDFHTYGMNNKVNCGAEKTGIDKMYGLYRGTANSSLGNTYTPTIATTGTQTLISPIRVSNGDTIVVNSQSKNSRFKYAIVDENNKVLKARESGYTNINTTINIDIENANKIIIDFLNGEEMGNKLKVVINNISYNVEMISDTTKILDDVIDLSKYYYRLNNSSSITMPKRISDYKVRLVNADITPINYNTMLYPKFIDTVLPITGKIDYSKYKGRYLSWAFAYTTNDVTRTPLDSRKVAKVPYDYNKLYSTDYVDIVDVWAYKDDDYTNRTNNPNITKAYIELTQGNYQSRVDEVLQWYPNCSDIFVFEDGTVTELSGMFESDTQNVNHKNQIINFTFMDGYFNQLVSLYLSFRGMINLKKVVNIPDSVENMYICFGQSENLEEANIPLNVTNLSYCFAGLEKLSFHNLDLSKHTKLNSMTQAFLGCNLTGQPILPSNYKGELVQTFQATKITTAPVIPDGVTSLKQTFENCKQLTTVGNIPDNCTNYDEAFNGCLKLTSVPETGWKGAMKYTFAYTPINQKIVIESAQNLTYTFRNCSELAITPTIPKELKGKMDGCFCNCPSLITPPQTPEGVIDMNNSYSGCNSLTTAPYIPNTCTNITNLLRSCDKLTVATIPLTNLTTYDNALTGCTSLTTINWEGQRSSDFNLITLGAPSYSKASVRKLANEYLATVESATLTLSESCSDYLSAFEIFSLSEKGWKVIGAGSSGGSFKIVKKEEDASTFTTDDTVTMALIELTTNNYKTRIYEVLKWYPNCTEICLFGDGSVTTLKSMFDQTDNKKVSAQITKISTLSGYLTNVTDMSFMFQWTSFKTLDLSGFNTDNVTSMSNMFNGCSSLTTLDLSSFNTSKVIGMNSMFKSCTALKSLDLSTFSTSKVTNMESMFLDCRELTSVNIPGFDTSNVTNMAEMFRDCYHLTSLDLSKFNTSKVTRMDDMFKGCSALKTLDVSSFDTSKVTNMSYMFGSCYGLTSLDLSNFDTSKVTDMSYMFSSMSKLTNLKISNFNTSNVTNMRAMFYGDSNLTTLDLSNFNTSNVIDMQSMFSSCSNLTSLNLSSFDTSKITSMYYMFNSCSNLTTLDLSNFDTSKVTEMTNTFRDCSKLTSLNISGFNTSNVTNMQAMFYGCNSLESLDLSSFNTSKVTGMYAMFAYCRAITSLDLTNFDTSNVTDIGQMFYTVSSLLSLKFHFNFKANYEKVLLNINDNLIIDWLGEYVDNINLKLVSSLNFSLTNIRSLLLALGTVESATLTMYADQLNALTEEEKANAVSKGWTLQSA